MHGFLGSLWALTTATCIYTVKVELAGWRLGVGWRLLELAEWYRCAWPWRASRVLENSGDRS